MKLLMSLVSFLFLIQFSGYSLETIICKGDAYFYGEDQSESILIKVTARLNDKRVTIKERKKNREGRRDVLFKGNYEDKKTLRTSFAPGDTGKKSYITMHERSLEEDSEKEESNLWSYFGVLDNGNKFFVSLKCPNMVD